MVEKQSVPLDLITSPLFEKKHNLLYSDSDFNGGNNFQFVFAGTCPDDISDCLNTSTGVLNSSVSVGATANVALTLKEIDDYNNYVVLTKDITVSLSSDIDVKGVFLRKKSNGFVLMAMVNQRPMRFCDGVTFEKDNILFKRARPAR